MPLSNKLQRQLQVTLGKTAGSEMASILNTAAPGASQYSAATNTTSFTATAAQFAGTNFCVLNCTGTLGSGQNITTPTAAAIIAAMGSPLVGGNYRLRIINSSGGAFSWTVVAGSGVTINGTATIAQNTWRDFLVTVATASTITMQSIGTGTTS